MSQYISWLEENNGTIPFPRSWDLSAAPQRTDGHPGWGNYTESTPDGYTVFTRYANRFFNSTKSQDLFHAHIDQVLNRNNTVTGTLYKDDPTILAWEAANEPQVSVDAPTTNGVSVEWSNATAIETAIDSFTHIRRTSTSRSFLATRCSRG
jgi:hypothetical protein